jgi:hypothetical protein
MNSKNLNIFKNKEDFLKKFKNNDLAVNCEAVDEANDFLKFLDKNGITWIRGESLIKNNYYNSYYTKMCYDYNNNEKGLMYGGYDFYDTKGYEIIKFSDIKDLISLAKPMLIKIDKYCKNCIFYDLNECKCNRYESLIECDPDEYCFTSIKRPIYQMISSCSNCRHYDSFNGECLIIDEKVSATYYCEKYIINHCIIPLIKY